MPQRRHTLLTTLVVALLPVALTAQAAKEKVPPKSVELACEAMPGEGPGNYVCETREAFEQCQALVGGAPVLLNGAATPAKVLRCVQGG